ncbi:hypothetical protein [Streptomyces sp. FxanaA7]|uniref:hypothetical protein n=1 Tax=Streptomyces sp. FxanaA7 TaxID=1265492 RepID=UPI0005EDBAAA|nr:hypothetical protein [Streptomyces sp. FxanaA7]
MPALTADRTPDQLVGELQRFFAVDWPTVWAGVPVDADKRAHWCAGFGWQSLWFQSGLRVRTALGGRLHLVSLGPALPVTRAEHTLWAVRSRDLSENDRTADLSESRWHAYFSALRGYLGNPTHHSTWNSPDFPALPGPHPWPDARWRAEHQDPHRVAVWRFVPPHAPLVELRLTLSAATRHGPVPADARIVLVCHDPAHVDAERQARRG